jgi:hypothetical protein
MLPDYVSIIDMVPASSACRLGRVVAQVARPARNDAIAISRTCHCFCDAALPDPSYSRAKGELFCIT